LGEAAGTFDDMGNDSAEDDPDYPQRSLWINARFDSMLPEAHILGGSVLR
jgi:hypothetical protein|tara:strand:+ start:2615 stop:2764 length:150 start_codon:yes stop_codon:yes gene_type:complete